MIKFVRRIGVVAVAAALAVGVAAAPASAHAVTDPNTAESIYFETAIRVGHSCPDVTTTAMRVTIPEGVHLVLAKPVPGWKLKVTRKGLLGRATEVAWTGGSLPDHTVQLFPFSVIIGPHAPDVIWFPTIQECSDGDVLAWVEIPPSVEEWGNYERPAPYVINNAWW